MEIEANEEYDDGITRSVAETSDLSIYLNYPVFDVEPNFASQLSQSFDRPYDRLVFLGESFVESDYDETEFTIKMSYLQKSKSELQQIIDFFDSVMGRWGNFWIPSWQADVMVTEPFLAEDRELYIEDIEFSSYWLNTFAGRHITILFPDNTRVNRMVIGAPSANKIRLNNVIGKSCGSSQLSRLLVSFLMFARLNQDEIEIEYESGEFGRLNLSFGTLFTESS
jgi:hypothetical protein